MGIYKLIFFVLIFLILGFVIYRFKPYHFTDNSKFILNLLFEELKGIYSNLKNKELKDKDKISLEKRKDEIYITLKEFFGKNLKLKENELVF
ncbi:MAG TPA: hypothetical protein PKD00_08400 [Burkholderiales bacterium]|nr:hypothetical protein [Burkholderiales bacterium]